MRERSRLNLRPLPRGLRMKVTPNDYARFYGNAVMNDGRIKKFGFRVKVNLARHSGHFYGVKMSSVMAYIKNKTAIPLHSNGDMYPTFKDLFASPWVKVRRIREYHAGMRYGK